MTESQAKMAAEQIADLLFTNGFELKADRLVITSAGGKDLGGWCKEAVIKQIVQVLWMESRTHQ